MFYPIACKHKLNIKLNLKIVVMTVAKFKTVIRLDKLSKSTKEACMFAHNQGQESDVPNIIVP